MSGWNEYLKKAMGDTYTMADNMLGRMEAGDALMNEGRYIMNEKLSWGKYLKEIGVNHKKFMKDNPDKYEFFKNAYSKSTEALDFEQNHLDDLERVTSSIKLEKCMKEEVEDDGFMDGTHSIAEMVADSLEISIDMGDINAALEAAGLSSDYSPQFLDIAKEATKNAIEKYLSEEG